MKIKIDEGVVVALSITQNTSVHGGTYDIDDEFGKEAVKRKGVTDVTKQINIKAEVTNAD